MPSKAQLRQAVRLQCAQCSEAQKEAWSDLLAAALMAHPAYRHARTVLLYRALPDEISLDALLSAPGAADKSFWFPRVVDDMRMTAAPYSPQCGFSTGRFHIEEPIARDELAVPQFDLIIVPGRAFDGRGHRLGRGRGYYDRFLSDQPAAYKLGVCFPFQFFSSIPAEPHDWVMDEVLHP